MKGRVLVIEDDESLRRGLRFNLEREDYEVHAAGNVVDGDRLFAEMGFDLVLLDLGLPDGDGTDLLRRWREAGATTPVICLTARTSEAEVVMGLSLGADDYVRKPFGLSELMARVAVRLDRSRAEAPSILELGPVRLDWRSGMAKGPEGEHQLTPQELELMRFFAAHPGEALPRERLLEEIWGLSGPQVTRTLDNHVLRLRRKLEADPKQPRHLLTVHGVGYRFEPHG